MSLERHTCRDFSYCLLSEVFCYCYLSLVCFPSYPREKLANVNLHEIMNGWAFKTLLVHGKAPTNYMVHPVILSTLT